MSAIAIGTQVEDLAVAYLQNHNIMILQRNFSCKLGEIDIIAQQNDCIIFVEVRYRKYDAFGSAAESVTHSKQQKIIRTAEFYLQNNAWATKLNCRFDVITISNVIESTQIEWIKDAFNA